MTAFTLKGIPPGIGWHNALGVAMARVRAAEAMHASSFTSNEQQLRSDVLRQNRLRAALSCLYPNPSRVETLLSVIREAPLEGDQYRTALHMLDLYHAAHPNETRLAAANVLDDIVCNVMFHEVVFEKRFTMDAGNEAGNRYEAISIFLGKGDDRIFHEAEELRSDADLLLSDNEGKVAFARTAYASIIPLMDGDDSIAYEIRSIMSVATHPEATSAIRKATVHLLSIFEVHHAQLLSSVAAEHAQELRDEIAANAYRWRKDELQLAVEEYGFVSMWMKPGCRDLIREIDAWHLLLRDRARPPAALALRSISYLIYNLDEDGRDSTMRKTIHELISLLDNLIIDTVIEPAAQLVEHLIEASDSEASLMRHVASKLRRFAQRKQSPALLLNIYAAILPFAGAELLAVERAHIERSIQGVSSRGEYALALQETLNRIETALAKPSGASDDGASDVRDD